MTTMRVRIQQEMRYSNQWPKKGEAWLHIRRNLGGYLEGWGEYTVKVPGVMIGSSWREWSDWEDLRKAAFDALGDILAEGDRRVLVRYFDADE